MSEWKCKFKPNEVCTVNKNGNVVRVQIEGVRMGSHLECPLYDVREVHSREGYPALETSLAKWKGKPCDACDGLGGIAIAGPDKSWPAMACPKCGAGSTT